MYLPLSSCVLLLGICTGSAVVHAQAAVTQPSSQAPAPKTEARSEADEINAYRHSATVQWFARLLHIDVETAAVSFEYINFAVILLAIGIPLFKWLPKIFRQRSARLNADLQVAEAKTADANQRLNAVEGRLAGLDAEIAAIRKHVEEDMQADETRNKKALEEETARIVAAAEHEIVMAGSLAQRSLRQFVANLAIDRALSSLTLDADSDRALIAEFTQDVTGNGRGRKHASKGENN
jgi:F0F1-type ATP synthase membrane subunit b/b'